MQSREYKQKFIEALYMRDDGTPHTVVKAKPNHKYVIRCPYCGDSSNVRSAHFYLHINPDDNSPILYNCFKCPAGGKVDAEVVEKIGITDADLVDGISNVNRNADVVDHKNVNGEPVFTQFHMELPTLQEHPKLDYLRGRLGIPFSIKECEELKAITSLKAFLKLNKIQTLGCNKWVAEMYERDYLGFLSNGGSYILFRDVTDRNEISWVKYPIKRQSLNSYVWYSIDGEADIFSKDTVTIHLAEGIMDIIGVKYHLVKKTKNQIYIAVTGKSYLPVIYHLIRTGFVGCNVVLKIYADNDAKFNKKNRKVEDTSIEFYRKTLSSVKLLFKAVYVVYNDLAKDFGVPINQVAPYTYKL